MARARAMVPHAYKELAKKAEAHGWTIEHGGRHLKWIPPQGSGQTPVYASGSRLTSNRSVLNTRSRLRQRGLAV